MKYNLIQCDERCNIIQFIIELKSMAERVENYQDSVIGDYRTVAKYETQEIIDKLLNFEV